jgi:YD repeat-containing protein
MNSTLENDEAYRELAHRTGGGIEITLYWNADDQSTSVEVFDAATGQTLRFAVSPEHALDAFYHPFAHMQMRQDDAAFLPQRARG